MHKEAVYRVQTHMGPVDFHRDVGAGSCGHWIALVPGYRARDMSLSSALSHALHMWHHYGKPKSAHKSYVPIELTIEETIMLVRIDSRPILRDCLTGTDSFV